MLLAIIEKAAAYAGAFFVSAVFSSSAAAGECVLDRQAGKVEKVQLKDVIDGDTIRLTDGRLVRFTNINAPEIAYKDKPAEPYGEQARKLVDKLLRINRTILLQVSPQKQDHYGRTLGQIFTAEEESVSEALLKNGLSFQTFMSDHDFYQSCFTQQEKKARKNILGVWKNNPISVTNNNDIHAGFMMVRGKVHGFSSSQKSQYIQLNIGEDMVLSVPKAIAPQHWVHSLINRTVEARGWVVDRNNKKNVKRWMMIIHQSDSISILGLPSKEAARIEY